ncbi:hypothetical protein [Bradyrhizobium sp. Tv2a-2]|uniref:hypothetical protein n=1 Tax=Bradyrhizobium sp. Tv2a-2 TaxID=113395 RepID=UPI0012EB3A4B|nr:hypothetical protein [Bradyrhizobium sp. Tv2a-2]
MAIDRPNSAATAPQRAFKPRFRLPGCHSLGVRLPQLSHQTIGALALMLEICPVTGCRCFEPHDLRLQCHDLYCELGGVA